MSGFRAGVDDLELDAIRRDEHHLVVGLRHVAAEFGSVARRFMQGRHALALKKSHHVIDVGLRGNAERQVVEAGAVVVVYCLLVGFFAYRELNAKSLWSATLSTMVSLGMIGLLIAGGTVFTRLLIREGAAQALAEGILGLFQSKTLILLSLNVFLLILGMFIDGIPILILAVPMILPLISQLDMNLVHLGSMIIVNVGLGVDGSASNDGAHMLGEARQALLLQRVGFGPAALTARQALELATHGGAAVLNRTDIGQIAPGKAADIVAFDVRGLDHAGALHDPVAALIFAAPVKAALSIVNGKVVVRDGLLQTVDTGRLVERHNALARSLVNG